MKRDDRNNNNVDISLAVNNITKTNINLKKSFSILQFTISFYIMFFSIIYVCVCNNDFNFYNTLFFVYNYGISYFSW